MRAQLLSLFILIGCGLFAQDPTLVTIKRGSRIRDVLKPADIFFQPEFVNGKVFFKNGVVSGAKMNYSSLLDQMLFIDIKGDTLALTNEKTIQFIALGKDTFYFVEGYVRLLAGNSAIKLAEKNVWQLSDVRKIGAHNIPVSTYAVQSFRTITDGFGRTYDLIMDEDIVLKKSAFYYFGDEYSFAQANKKNLLSFFPKKENMLSGYLKENKVNFSQREDLDKLIRFLGQNY